MDCIFNELSASILPSVFEAQSMLSRFVNAARKSQEFLFDRIRISDKLGLNLYSLEISKNYKISNWLEDPSIDKDIKDRFRLIIANPPLFKLEEISEADNFEYSEYKIQVNGQEIRVEGLGIAHLLKTVAISMNSLDLWAQSTLEIQKQFLNDHYVLQTEKIDVLNVSEESHWEKHREWLDRTRRESLQTCREVWNRREEFFPNIVLCGVVEKQMELIGSSTYLNQIIDRLKSLDAFASTWSSGKFDIAKVTRTTNLDISGESVSTLKRYSAERKFKLPSGLRVVHELHIKVGNLRFHFYPDDQTQTVYVGYIGKHLNTVSG